jgi:hypothetical protein
LDRRPLQFSTAVYTLRLLGWLDTFLGDLDVDGPFHWNGAGNFPVVMFKLIPAVLTFAGALQMMQIRYYALAVGAAIVAIVFCGLIGCLVGIWALVILLRPEARQTFAGPLYPTLK